MAELLHANITGEIIKAFYCVYNTLGFGFLEKVYENSLVIELRESGLSVVQQNPISVFYKDTNVGEYFADLLVENTVIVELKSVEKIIAAHETQLLNYLRATTIEVGLLLNFGQSPGHKRKVYTNDRKDPMSQLLDS